MYIHTHKCIYVCVCIRSIFKFHLITSYVLTERQLLIDEVEEIAKQWLSFEMSAAEYEPFRERIKAEKEIYFIPSMRQGKISHRHESQQLSLWKMAQSCIDTHSEMFSSRYSE